MFVNSEIHVSAQFECIKWGWSHALTSRFDGDLCADSAGLEYRGIYKKSA